MIVAGIGWISGEKCGAMRRGWQDEFKDANTLYGQLEEAGVFNTPAKKVRWFCDLAQRFCLASALALRDAFDLPGHIALDPSKVGMLSLSRDGALKANLDYFKDYIESGRKSARGNLFIRTLPTSSLAQVAMTFGFKGPIVHLSSAAPELGHLADRSDALENRIEGLNLLSCVADDKTVICFFLKPAEMSEGIYSTSELKDQVGKLWNLDEVLETLKIAMLPFQKNKISGNVKL